MLRRVPTHERVSPGRFAPTGTYDRRMCRNITELRGLEPPATDHDVEAAARQFIRKVSGLQKPPAGVEDLYERAIGHVAGEVRALLDALPNRRQPLATVPPLRRPEVRARIAAREAASRAG
jgi:hypothetical protein